MSVAALTTEYFQSDAVCMINVGRGKKELMPYADS